MVVCDAPMLMANIQVALARVAARRQIMQQRLAQLRDLRREMRYRLLQAKINAKLKRIRSRAREQRRP